ncbi:hydroxyacid dehydrogenase [Marispirochaeta sp.]|uniref:hydroxyacid dehydrogenase n=1 Tax=Marispirochaeta sp. TaxID=2038653 RepID=UPI0029C88A15|nr:hydroxyacid dehydrogenase [Marispirochaeta sp.]
MYKVAVTQKLHDDGLAVLQKESTVLNLDKKTPLITAKEIAGQDGLIIRIATIDQTAIEASPQLKVIGRPGVGYDSIDMAAATESGILVVVTPGANTLSVAEHAVAMMMMFAKDMLFCDRELRKGNFQARNRYKAFELDKKVLGLIGLGNIGKETARLAKGLGMSVAVYDPIVSQKVIEALGYTYVATLDDLLKASDIISIHVPLLDSTKNLISGRELEIMKREALLVNCSRGGIVDEDALYDALVDEKIAGAALDVFSTEPPPADDRLFTLDNVIVTPHMAAQTKEAVSRMATRCAQGVLAVIRGEHWPHVVNPEAYDHPRWKK